jgi:predicted HTH transcriptional regulator
LTEFLKIKSLDDLKSIETSGFEEGLTLEYKSSDALCKEKADDICKDVSALANSSGGQIITE